MITWQTGFPELSSWGAKYSRNTITHYNSERGQSKDYTGYQSTSTTVERTHWGLYSARVQVERTPCGLHSVSVHEYNIHENTLRTTQCTLPWEQQPRGHREYYIVYPSRSTTVERTTHAVYPSTDITSIIIIIITKETIDYICMNQEWICWCHLIGSDSGKWCLLPDVIVTYGQP